MSLDQKYKSLLNSYHINTPKRVAMFMSNFSVETNGFTKYVENLNYSAQGLANTFPSRYAVDPKAKIKVPNSLAESLNRNPEAIANNCYANRMGNGDEASGDGWKYRGRGFMITGKKNYIVLSKDTRIDFLNHPELLEQEANSVVSACWFWQKNKLNDFADKDDFDGVCDIINIGRKTVSIGDAIGYKNRKEMYNQWLELLT
jgi:putative chitinase